MELQTKIHKEGDVAVLEISGKLSYLSQKKLEKHIFSVVEENEKLVVDMSSLNFVGSSGIRNFFYALRDHKIHFCNVSQDFQRIMKAYNVPESRIYRTRMDAVNNFFNPPTTHEN